MTSYKIIGLNDEQTVCDCCGRKGLKRTVVLERHESGENTLDIIRVGVDCAAILSAKSGKVLSAARIKREATKQQSIADRETQWAVKELAWKIQNRIADTIEKANEIFRKQYPVCILSGKTDHGKLLTDGRQFVRVAIESATSSEQRFSEYLHDNNFKAYERASGVVAVSSEDLQKNY